jgi:hypothetical protein
MLTMAVLSPKKNIPIHHGQSVYPIHSMKGGLKVHPVFFAQKKPIILY